MKPDNPTSLPTPEYGQAVLVTEIQMALRAKHARIRRSSWVRNEPIGGWDLRMEVQLWEPKTSEEKESLKGVVEQQVSSSLDKVPVPVMSQHVQVLVTITENENEDAMFRGRLQSKLDKRYGVL